MGSRWFNVVIVLFWLCSMSWLVMAKVLPPLSTGEPPNYAAVYARIEDGDPPICWGMTWNGQPLGWAITRFSRSVAGIETRSHVHFSHLPVDEMAPAWMRALLRNQLQPLTGLTLDARSTLYVELDGKLRSFRSAMQVSDMPDVIRMYGDVRGKTLHLTVESGDIKHSIERYVPASAVLNDELSPQARLPNLRFGQSWSVEAYNPFRPPSSPMDLLRAKVEETDIVAWAGRTRDVYVVVYRAESGLGFLSRRDARAKLWVSKDDGMVFKQEIDVLGSRLTFDRLDRRESDELLKSIGEPTSSTIDGSGSAQGQPADAIGGA